MAPESGSSGNSGDFVRRESQEFAPASNPYRRYNQNVYAESSEAPDPVEHAPALPASRGSAGDGAQGQFGFVDQLPPYESAEAYGARHPQPGAAPAPPSQVPQASPPSYRQEAPAPLPPPRRGSDIQGEAPRYPSLRTQTVGDFPHPSRPSIPATHGFLGRGFTESPQHSPGPSTPASEQGNPLGGAAGKNRPPGSDTSGPVSSYPSTEGSPSSSQSSQNTWYTARTHQPGSPSRSPGGQKGRSR